MSNVRTVSDTKRAFYNHFNRPITSVYRRVIEELMVEMHLLSVSADFVYDSLYALGIVTTFDRFMEGYRPDADRAEIFTALCQSTGSSAEQYRNDAQQLLESVKDTSIENFRTSLSTLDSASPDGLLGLLQAVSHRGRFKYSRAFGIGLYTVLETNDSEFVNDKEQLMAFLKEVSEATNISFDKLQKDVELYRSNLDKMGQAKAIMADMLAAERKKREERAQAQAQEDDAQTAAEEDIPAVPTSAGDGSEEESQES